MGELCLWLIAMNVCLASASTSSETIFRAQFTKQPSLEKFWNLKALESSQHFWYKWEISHRYWKSPTMGDPKIEADTGELIFKTIQLPFRMPFFGRFLENITITSAGGVFMPVDTSKSWVIIPSYIAPLMTGYSQTRTHVYWEVIKGKKLEIRWSRYPTDDLPFEVYLLLYHDGSITFQYANVPNHLGVSMDLFGSSILMGMADGFTTSDSGPIGLDEFYYTPISLKKTILGAVDSSKPMTDVRFTPQELCQSTQNEVQCNSSPKECVWLSGECLNYIERYRYAQGTTNQSNWANDPKIRDLKDYASCPIHCQLLPSDWQCGSDGIIYENECWLKHEQCIFNQNLRVTGNDICSPDCQADCPIKLEAFCGTDDITYSNKCKLALHACKNKDLQVKHGGTCDTGSYDYDYDDYNLWDDYSEEIYDTEENDPERCNEICNTDLRPVCLNGDQNFGNKCLMEHELCSKNLTSVHWQNGTCHSQEHRRDCSVTRGCTRELSPVCGSNNITYANPCILQHIACTHKLNLTILALGPCVSEGGSYCPPPICTRERNPVCGSDGTTYDNMCIFVNAQVCDPSLKMTAHGVCNALREVEEPPTTPNDQEHIKYVAPVEEGRGSSGRILRGCLIAITMGCLALGMFFSVRYYQRRQRQQFPMTSQISEEDFNVSPTFREHPLSNRNTVRSSNVGIELNSRS